MVFDKYPENNWFSIYKTRKCKGYRDSVPETFFLSESECHYACILCLQDVFFPSPLFILWATFNICDRIRAGEKWNKDQFLNSRQVSNWKCNIQCLKEVIKCLSPRQCHTPGRETARHNCQRVSLGSVRLRYSECERATRQIQKNRRRNEKNTTEKSLRGDKISSEYKGGTRAGSTEKTRFMNFFCKAQT